jgi:pimeloyl-ACP methyl ester carboxylesterase
MSGDKCVFPFTYKGTKYQYCTKMDHHSAWCATETDLKGNYVADKWGHCNRECEMQAGSECTTDDENKECVFPFVYQGIHYIGCTKKDHHSAWCATETDREGNYVESAWGHCSEECKDRKACRATDDNECAFPFVYKGETFVSCTLKDHHSAWCATSTSSSGLVEEWGYCNEACEVCQTKDNAVCIFPFEYKGVTYTSCTDKDQHAAWCATDTDADGKFVVGQWGHCIPECQVCHTFNGAECVFPFTYDGREYKTCTDKNHSSAWCATQTDKTGGVKSWGHCRPQCEQEYDCSGSESKASWSPSKRAWCCDREDVGCEAIAVGVKSTSNSKVDTTTTAMTTETSRLKATSARESKASGEERNWTKSEHPYFAAVKESCTQDLKKYCSTKSFKDRSFLRAVNCLAEHRSNLDRKCADAAFSGTLENPHPKLFKIVNEGEEQECNITVHNDDGTISITPSTWRFVSGYVMAPLMYTTPSSTPIFNTWFSMVPALTQPAPKGIIFLHTGGPLPAMLSVAGAAFGDWFGKHTMYIRNNYDVVSVDQRGMGMSSLELLYGISPDTFSNYTWHEFATVMQGVAQNKGDLFSSVSIVVSDDKGNVTGDSPCKQEETDHADLDENGFFAPWNFADEEQVDDWFTKKASVTKYCSDKFDKDDGEGETYSPLQYVGTGALTYDMEYMRLAFGGPKISLVGFSYGTRVAAAYASAFPYSTARMGVTGVMAPIPDLLEYAQKAADNTAEILGWIVSQCAQEESCSKNPWNRSESSEFFEGGIDEAVNELFNRSMDGGRWYTEHCGKNATPLSLKGLTQQFEGFLTTTQDPTQGMLTKYQNSTWPWGFAGLPAMVYALLNEPCFASTKFGLSNVMLSIMSSWSDISIFSLIPALDMTGRFDKIQAVRFLTTFASNPVFAPGLNMFILYASASYGWPQLPMPIGFSNQNVPAVIANGLYDERTGMAYAQDFKLHFPNSSLVTSLSGGHCVGYDQGAQAWELLVKFLINGTLPLDGTVTGEYIPIDFEMGRTVLMQGWRMIPPDEVV